MRLFLKTPEQALGAGREEVVIMERDPALILFAPAGPGDMLPG